MNLIDKENNMDYCKCGHPRIKHYFKHKEEETRNGGCRTCFCKSFRLRKLNKENPQ